MTTSVAVHVAFSLIGMVSGVAVVAGRWRTVYVVGRCRRFPFQAAQLAALAVFVGLTIGAVLAPAVYLPNR